MSTVIKLPMKVNIYTWYADMNNNYCSIDLPYGIDNLFDNIEYYKELSNRYYNDNDITIFDDDQYKLLNNINLYNSVEDIEFTIDEDNHKVKWSIDDSRINELMNKGSYTQYNTGDIGYSPSEPVYSDSAPSDV